MSSLFLAKSARPTHAHTQLNASDIYRVFGLNLTVDVFFRKKQYISAKKADIFEIQKVLIISAPRQQIATTVVPLASTKTC